MLIWDEDLGEMVDDNRKTYECPKCDRYWTNEEGLRELVKYDEDDEDREFEAWPKDKELKRLTVLRIDDGKEIEYRKYPEKLCPDCSEKMIDGRRKGPYTKVNSMLEGENLKCQVCGCEDFDLKLPDIAICESCNTYHYGEYETVGGVDYVRDCYGYREDLDNGLMKCFQSVLDIIVPKATLIKKGGGHEGN